MRMTPIHLLLLGVIFPLTACEKSSNNPKFVVAEWVAEHKPAVEKLRTQLDAAAKLVAKLPPRTVRAADPATPVKAITKYWRDGENMVILRGTSLPGLPEYGRDDGKTNENSSISIGYTGYVDLASAFSMVDKGEALYIERNIEGRGLAKNIARIRYVIISREVSYKRGAVFGSEFTPGSYEGVAHIVDLQGPRHLGSVRFRATNTSSFETYKGSADSMLRFDLQHAAMRAFHAQLGRSFPGIGMPNPPQKKAR